MLHVGFKGTVALLPLGFIFKSNHSYISTNSMVFAIIDSLDMVQGVFLFDFVVNVMQV